MKKDKYLEMDFTDNQSDFQIDRREFLKIAGGGIIILFTVWDSSLFSQESRGRRNLPSDFNAFLRIGEDGRVSCFTGKIEMGQGVITSLAQMLADELDVSLDAVDMVMGDTDLCPWDMGTFGSMTTRFFGPPLREAAAAPIISDFHRGARPLPRADRCCWNWLRNIFRYHRKIW